MSHDTKDVLLALGSNINRKKNLPRAFDALSQHPSIELCAVSPVYESLPVGGRPDQPIYYNAATYIKTVLEPADLKDALRQIEQDFGRVRTKDKYASRPIDIDITMYAQQIFALDGNHIPDPDLTRYPHIALPIADIAAGWVHPENGLFLRQIADSLTYDETEIYQV
ncbi:MAG: 2-amino-4-hydroxy-6-hydroxymethyldihydropteridine diphosphokinase [Chloroflexota bacterium]